MKHLVLAGLLVAPALAIAATQTPGKIDAVTVYRGQAVVTRAVELPRVLPAAAGAVQEIVVTDLPAHLRPESLHAETTPGVQIRSVTYRTRPVVQDTREEVRAIDARIEELQGKLGVNARKVALLGEDRAYLASLQGFIAPTAAVEMTRGVLNAETIEKLSGYLIKQRAALTETELTLASEAKKLNADLEQAQRERQLTTAGSSRTVHEAVVLLTQIPDAPGTLRLRYLVDGATWDPSYNVRSTSDKPDSVTIEYYASISQMSGEDWSDVAITLSTATPSLIASAPRLTPLTISLSVPVQQTLSLTYDDARRDLRAKLRDAERERAQNFVGYIVAGGSTNAPPPGGAQVEADKSLNTLANDLQVLDLIAQGAKVERARASSAVPPQEGLSVTYSIPARTSLPSRSERQLIQIAAVPFKAEFARMAMPVLTGYVYHEASAANTGASVLLAGPVTAYRDGAFVGSGEMPTIASGQRFSSGFGIDASLRTSRELVERVESTQGGNRVVELTYRLIVENFSDAPAPIRLLDRLPKVDDKRSDVRLTLVSPGGELSSDAAYLAGPRKDGILRWDVTIPPNASGQDAFALEYKFRLEFDKQMGIVGLGG
ncbi:MAG: mucoidy inhibitor MuiA family protein [Phycisphaerales bacterium]|nr:mucoidy inhibitor MuiA family protein [Phycisphaerales bacterium]